MHNVVSSLKERPKWEIFKIKKSIIFVVYATKRFLQQKNIMYGFVNVNS